jgi:hypothetical protein
MNTIMHAMRDKGVEEQIKELVKENKLVLVDQSNKVLFENEIKEGLGVKRQNSQMVTQKEKSAKKGGDITPTQSSHSDQL